MTVQCILGGAVASEHRRASEIGTDILKAGGNAVDAIVATIIAVNTLCPYHSDLGGGGFAIIRESDGTYNALNFRHEAPKAVTMEWYQKGASTAVGGSAVAIPGQMRGLGELHSRYGRLPWADLLNPSIQLARDGFPIGGDFRSFTLRDIPDGSEELKGSWYESDSEFHSLFKDGKALPLGAIYRRSDFARTLSILAEQGAEAFYQGAIAEGIVEVVKDRGGLMELTDLAEYRPKWCEPVKGHFRGQTVWTVPAPASGSVFLSALSMLDSVPPAKQGSVDEYHLVTESLRLAYGLRAELGDPTFVPEVKAKEKEWTSEQFIASRSKMLSRDKTFPPSYYQQPGIEVKDDNGTSNITVADGSGLVVSITTTVGLNWGSRIMVPGFGFILNDSMDDFSVKGRPNATGYEPSPANYVQGGKRPLSSSCPYIVEGEGGKVIMAGGAAGGSTIISANVQVIRNVIDHGMLAKESLRANRLHNQILPNVTQIERSSEWRGQTIDGFSDQVAEGLRSKGHVIEWVDTNRSTPCVITFGGKGGWQAESDTRKYDTGGSVFVP